MDRKAMAIILVIILAVGGGIVFLLTSSSDKTAKQDMINQADSITPTEDMNKSDTGATVGAYIDYAPSVLAETSGIRLLFFHAPWCPQCRDLDADIRQNGVPAGVTIIKVDYDTSHELRQKYGVTLQTTVVRVDDQGDLVEKYVAYDDPTVEAIKRNLLK